MWLFYVLSILPLVLGAILWYNNKSVVWWEFVGAFAVAFITAAIFHVIAFHGMTGDKETWSGSVTHVTYYPRWVERYTESETYTDSDGKLHSRTVTKYRTHEQHWTAYSDIDSSKEVEESFYRLAMSKFGGTYETERGNKDGFYSGDPNIYPTYNKTGYLFPINEHRSFTNRVACSPTLFSFSHVPKSVPVFDYPKNENWFVSERLVGTASSMIDIGAFDRMNARLGPTKKVNVILVGFPAGSDLMLGVQQQSKWIGGKKNDVVICFGGGSSTSPAEWTYCFGWTEKELLKENLKTLFLNKPINNLILKDVESEIRLNYVKKDWKKFDYIGIEPPTWSYFVFFTVLVLGQVGFWIWAVKNNFDKEGPNNYYGYGRAKKNYWLRV